MIQQYSADYLRQIDKIDWQNPVNWNHPLNNGLVSWWLAVPNHLGFGTNTWVDLCGRNHGTLTNMDAASDWLVGSEEGRWGSLDFDDTDDYVKITDGTLAATLDNCTVSVWFRTTNSSQVGGWALYTERGSSGNEIFKLDYGDTTGGAEPFFTWRNSAGVLRQIRFSSTFSANDNQWHNFVVRISGNNARLFYDYYTQAPGTLSTKSFVHGTIETWIGDDKGSGGTTTWGGSIDDVRVYNRALSDFEIAELYNESRVYHPSLLNRHPIKRYFVLSGGSGVTATASGSGSGTGSASATVVINAVAAGSGSGTGTATATVDIQASASGSGSGTGAANATVIIVAMAAGSGSGDGAAVVTPTVTGSAAGSGSGDGAATAVVTINATASGSGSGDGAATATVQITGVASGSGSGTGSATATITISATAAGSGSGTGVVIVSGVPVVYDVTIAVATVGAVALTSAAVGAVAITLGAEMYHVGDTLKITGTFTLDGTETDPTSVSLQVRDPSKNVATYTYPSQVSKESTGVFSYNLLLDEDGIWFVKWVGEGAVVTATEDTKLKVERTRFTYPPA